MFDYFYNKNKTAHVFYVKINVPTKFGKYKLKLTKLQNIWTFMVPETSSCQSFHTVYILPCYYVKRTSHVL